jgi:hypothetical protein
VATLPLAVQPELVPPVEFVELVWLLEPVHLEQELLADLVAFAEAGLALVQHLKTVEPVLQHQ